MTLTRRDLLTLLSGSTFLLNVRASGAGSATSGAAALPLSFPQGVASADPGPNTVMLWTRAVPRGGEAHAAVLLQVATNETFADPLLESRLASSRDSDYTLRAYIEGLEPDTRYYYRFTGSDGSVSRTGRTRTAPAAGQAREARVAFVSCQNYEQGFYSAWARMLADDEAAPPQQQIDFVLHLGDFIYERSWHRRLDGSAPVRTLPPFPDGQENEENRHAVSLADYRQLYRTYLSDPWLQAARARWPFICTWDDHEFSDDCFQSYSNYAPAPRLEARRKYAANQAWFEYIPCVLDELVRQPAHGLRSPRLTGQALTDNQRARDSLCIYRRLHWGRHLDILLADARSYRSPPCLDKGFAESLGCR
jgi:alkaline phosphatase D